MKIVLFGATGNVGRRIAKEALDRGHEVVGVVREPARVESPDARLTLARGDATDARDVARVPPRPGGAGKRPQPGSGSARSSRRLSERGRRAG